MKIMIFINVFLLAGLVLGVVQQEVVMDSDNKNSYWCVVCQREIENIDGVLTHDDIPHPDDMTFDEQEKPQ